MNMEHHEIVRGFSGQAVYWNKALEDSIFVFKRAYQDFDVVSGALAGNKPLPQRRRVLNEAKDSSISSTKLLAPSVLHRL